MGVYTLWGINKDLWNKWVTKMVKFFGLYYENCFWRWKKFLHFNKFHHQSNNKESLALNSRHLRRFDYLRLAVMTTLVCSIKSLYYRPNTDHFFSKNRPNTDRVFQKIQTKIQKCHSKEDKGKNRCTILDLVVQRCLLWQHLNRI